MEIVAHRGASGTHPENTMAAFTHASTLGVQWIETDVPLMGDGILLVHHDAHLGRVVAGEGRLADMTYPEVAGLDAGSWFGAEFADQRLLTLPKLLAWQATAGVGLNIEVKIHKQNHAALLASLTAALNTRDTREATATNPPPILVSSFDAEFLRLVAEGLPEVPRAFCSYHLPPDWQARVDACGAEAVHLNMLYAKPHQIAAIHQAGLRVALFTINTDGDMAQAKAWGVGWIMSDYPERFLGKKT